MVENLKKGLSQIPALLYLAAIILAPILSLIVVVMSFSTMSKTREVEAKLERVFELVREADDVFARMVCDRVCGRTLSDADAIGGGFWVERLPGEDKRAFYWFDRTRMVLCLEDGLITRVEPFREDDDRVACVAGVNEHPN
ncbi:MAG: hypothetical protein AAGC77_10670 [Pseudomonadota bacterium]